MLKKERVIYLAIAIILFSCLLVVFLLHKPESIPEETAIEEETENEILLYLDESLSIEERVNDLLEQMTIEEKIGQMVQSDRGFATPEDVEQYFLGSILSGGGSTPRRNEPEAWADMYDDYQKAALSTRLAIPILYGIDAVHGHNNVVGATIFPHNIGLGAANDRELVEEIGRITAREIRETGIHWNFGPVLAVPQNERWGRTYEGYAETNDIVTELGIAYLEGLQGELDDPTLMRGERVIGTAKHWVGDGATVDGIDQGNIILSEEELQYHISPYIDALEAGARTVMVSFSSWNGLKTHGDPYLVTEVLKGELGFTGLVVSDWNGHVQVDMEYTKAVKLSVNAGIDLFMVPNSWLEFIQTLKMLYESGEVSEDRINDAVTRILRVKFEAGLFEENEADRSLLAEETIGSPEHREVAREAVRKSLVLLKNENEVLPLSKDIGEIFVAGVKANDIGYQSGGWTITWQGSPGNITPGTTILEGIQESVSDTSTVTYSRNGKGAEGHDVAVVVIGEKPYAEMEGDTDDLSLTKEDLDLLANVKEAGIPTIVILLSGRPMIITDEIKDWDAFVAAWLPGTEGNGVSDVLFGDYDFTGTLSYTWPKTMEQIPIRVGDADYEPLFPFGYGLQYK
ncbi:glycoside hydrolase family 3 protein [Bacillus alkalicellulosilyticus]|uniref:glycoside hydrolase family 3 protein n=1 Tax=Alkalihalobacterium alkalicellulosilyticum TaxID=1912214 RepID=UPI00099603B5|nr:glycoside hydrolase family 3 N-terminal domain-containing protein [Bacillus alkalicellulosilyticus]